jgi:glutathione S-transferase
MLKLYGGERSRASIVQWYLEELSLPYEFVKLDMQAGSHRQPDFLAVNPMGKVPAIADGDLTLWESGAILLYLAEKYGSAHSLEQRAELSKWVLFANATLGPELFAEATRDRALTNLVGALNLILEKQPFLAGEQFSAADVAVGALLSYSTLMLKLTFQEYPAVADYLKRLSQRPAFQKTIGSRF